MNALFELPDKQQIIRTIAFLCERENFAYAVLDDEYRALWRHGKLASWIPLEVNVCRKTDLFFGLEKQLLDLQDDHGNCVTLPRVGVPSGDLEAYKMSVEVYWDDKASLYHVVIHRLVAESEVELELLKQIRARRLAEENFQNTRERLAQKETLLDIVMEHLPVPTAIFDENRRYLFASRRWEREFHVECEPLLGQDFFQTGPAIPEAEKQRFASSMAGLATRPETGISERGGEVDTNPQRWTHQPWRHPDGSQGGVLTAIEDRTNLASQIQKLKAQNNQLRAANRQLVNFTSIITHDLDAPLRSLRSVVDGAGSGNPPDSNNEYRTRIGDHIDRMKTIFDSMRDYMRVLCFEPAAVSVNIRGLVNGIVDTLPGKDAFDLILSLDKETIETCAGLLDLVLRNLLDNAIKHHDRHKGVLSVSLDDDGTVWRISVEDDGAGIPLAQQQALLNGKLPGEAVNVPCNGGMGLPIIVRAMEGIGGSLGIESDPSKHRGTKFILLWPKQFVAGTMSEASEANS